MIRLAALLLLTSLAGCASSPAPQAPLVPAAVPTVPFSLDGIWEVTAVGGEGTGGQGRYRISFKGGGFSAELGCNEMRGGYVVRAKQLVPTGGFSTERGCFDPRPGAPDPMRFEEAGFRILRRPMDMEMIGELLSLSNRAGAMTLRRLP